jgi:hypothetical protein
MRNNAEHAFAVSLLPWYVNETLDARECERVRRHLDECAACRDDLELLSGVRAAVCHSDTTPMVPPPNPERLLAACDRRASRGRRLHRAGLVAGAAALGLVTFVAGVRMAGPGAGRPPGSPERYRTLTSRGPSAAMDYVLELRFETGLGPAERGRVLSSLQATHVHSAGGDGAYRVTVSLPAASLAELDAFTRELEDMPEVRSARVIAMQLPVRPERP